jgi:U4/U6.U5 tri-snRNP-associated protein 1
VEETNTLRVTLGMAPLRIRGNSNNNSDNNNSSQQQQKQQPQQPRDGDEEVLELSVDATNALRIKLGLPLLRGSGNDESTTSNVSAGGHVIQNANLKEKQQQEDFEKAQAQAQLEQDVAKGIASTFTAPSLGATTTNKDDVSSWAAQLLVSSSSSSNNNKKGKKSKTSPKATTTTTTTYQEDDLKGLTVSHAMSELEAGSTTVMTLADAPLLQTSETNPNMVVGLAEDYHNDDDGMIRLENVTLAEAAKQADGLRKKRQLEMGMGRAGGYAGFDDDEFMELGGTRAPSRFATTNTTTATSQQQQQQQQSIKLKKGFQIGSDAILSNDATTTRDLFAHMEAGKAISLEPTHADVQASDFFTEQEDAEIRGKKTKRQKDKFDSKKKKKDKRKDKKDKKKHHRRIRDEEDDDESEEDKTPSNKVSSSIKTKTLLEELEETAEEAVGKQTTTKRSRRNDTGNEDDDHVMEEATSTDGTKIKQESEIDDVTNNKRAKYDAIMNKGNTRTIQAFAIKKKKRSTQEDSMLDEEPDDAFLNAALAKARRLKKLRGMGDGAATTTASGAEAVALAVRQIMPDDAPLSAISGQGVSFSIDDTREFSRALRAKSEQQSRKAAAKQKKETTPAANTLTTISSIKTIKQEQQQQQLPVVVESVTKQEVDDDVDMEELVKEIKDDDDDDDTNNFLEGTTGSTVAVGRGLAGVVNLFKQTGDLTRKNAGKEEMRGRAKDERTYEDYEALDLNKVVNIDDRYATDKDKELATREVKLEYRDKHGRLLTRKEAFRELCYQFHGHGSSKRKEEKRMKQMAREQAEARLASQQSNGGPGTFGALKATQKATGKAFVVHKT